MPLFLTDAELTALAGDVGAIVQKADEKVLAVCTLSRRRGQWFWTESSREGQSGD